MAELNIVFHGTFVFTHDLRAKKIVVKIPQLGGHVYRAGSWLGEVDLPSGKNGVLAKFHLQGVKTDGSAWLDRNKNLILEKSGDDQLALLRATIRMPLPKRIETPRGTRVSQQQLNRAFAKPPSGQVAGGDYPLATMQIFTYDLEPADGSLLMMKGEGGGLGLPWEPCIVNGSVNLHIWAAHEHHVGTGGNINPHGHAKEAFDACMQLSNSPVRLSDTAILGSLMTKADRAALPKGVLVEETEGLESRRKRLAQLGRMYKSGRDTNLLWFDSDALDSEPDACPNGGNEC